MKRLLFILILITISCSSGVTTKSVLKLKKNDINAEELCITKEIKYCLIIGKIVNGRNEPSINGKTVYKFIEGELVYYISKSENQDIINGNTDFWYKVENQTGKELWVFGQHIQLLDTKNLDMCVYQKLIEKKLKPSKWAEKYNKDINSIFYYGIQFQRKDFNNKKYFIIRYRIRSKDAFSGYKLIEGGSSSIFGIYSNEIEYIRGVSNYNLKYSFYDIDNDGYTDIFIQNSPTSLIAISEKGKKNLSPGWGFGGKMPNELLDSYLEVKEIVPGKECEIIKHYRFAKDQPMRVTKFKWDGQKFVEGPVE